MKFYIAFFAFVFSSIVIVQSYAILREDPVSDGCIRIHNKFVSKKSNKFSYEDVKDCYERIPFDDLIASKTIETLTRLLDGFYPFLDKAKEPPQSGFSFKSKDILAELKLLQKKSFQNLYDFIINVKYFFYDMKEPHTLFITDCFSTFAFITNITLYSIVKDDVFDDTIDPSNIDCEVTHINGHQAFEVIYKFAQDSVYLSRDIGVRFNTALDHKHSGYSFSVRAELPETPNIVYTLKCYKHTRSFNVTRNWVAFSTPSLLKRFNNSRTYFTNICNATEENKPTSYSSGLQDIKISSNSIHRIMTIQPEGLTIIKIIEDFMEFYKIKDFGVVRILTMQYPEMYDENDNFNSAFFTNIIQGFKDLTNTGVKKVVLDLTDNLGGYDLISAFISLLLFSNTYPSFEFDFRITEPMKLAITEQFKLAIPENVFDMADYADAKTYINFTSANDLFGNNSFTRGNITEHYSKKFVISNAYVEFLKEFIQNFTTPLPWKPEDYIILTNGLCGSACAMIVEHAVELNNVSTISIGGIASIPLLSCTSFPGGFVTDSDEILDSLNILGIQNNTLMPKNFPLTGIRLTLLYTETYSNRKPVKLLEYEFRPADFRLFYDEKNIKNISILWSQAAAFIGKKK
ncbi:25491_t:CDS:2 [Dentiscutata erythropus]|uniref:25491_t:CDS:1 n=1 Tax=Dentiscutata erythropus TaxID=1348616 RepID=A0A9N9DIT6_9GLOM|nr:25491_t:CDS:2 [Dentiscutata erythropus]